MTSHVQSLTSYFSLLTSSTMYMYTGFSFKIIPFSDISFAKQKESVRWIFIIYQTTIYRKNYLKTFYNTYEMKELKISAIFLLYLSFLTQYVTSRKNIDFKVYQILYLGEDTLAPPTSSQVLKIKKPVEGLWKGRVKVLYSKQEIFRFFNE